MPAAVKTVLDVLLFALFFDDERVGQQQTVLGHLSRLAPPQNISPHETLTTGDLTFFHHQIINKELP